MSASPRPVIAVVGPTAVGKTALAVAIAERLGGAATAALVNADSRQVIRGLRAGTCAPADAELRGIPCHLLDLRDPGERFTVAEWLASATPVLDGLDAAGAWAVLVGGTGLYVSAALDGLELSGGAPDPRTRRSRDALAEEGAGLAALVAELRARDPGGAATVDLRNPRRVVRALELVDAAGSVAAARRRRAPRPSLRFGLDAPRPVHDRLIAGRARRLFDSGELLEEVESARRRGIGRAALDAAGIGYREALAVIEGQATVDEAVDALVRRTRRYAKAQRTWFRRDPEVRWLERGEAPVETLVDVVVDALHQDARPGQRLPRRRRG